VLPLQALKQLAEPKVQVQGVAGQGALVTKMMTPAVTQFKEWAKAEKGDAFVATIDVTFDATPLAAGCPFLPHPLMSASRLASYQCLYVCPLCAYRPCSHAASAELLLLVLVARSA